MKGVVALRAKDGISRPRPVESASAPYQRPRIAKNASEPAGPGETIQQTRKSCGCQTNEDYANPQNEITEEPNWSSFKGLSKPTLIPYEERIIDAVTWSTVIRKLVNLTSLLLIVMTLAFVAATFIGISTSGLTTYAKWLGTLLVPLITMALGYYSGKTQSNQRHKR
jgi:hypothetical protein